MKFADSFRAARWVRLVNLLLQAVLFLSLFAGLNYIALNHSWRFDLTRNNRHSLSAETRSYLERLESPVRIIVTFAEDSGSTELNQAYHDITSLLREYAYATRQNDKGRIEVEPVDVYQNRRKAGELGIDQPNLVVLISGEHRHVLTLEDFYTIKNKVRRDAFKGEAALTSAILDVSSPEKKKIYFLLGHGEVSPDDVGPRGLSLLCDELRERNFALASLDLGRTRKIPDDAALLIVTGPQGRYLPIEEELLRNYLRTRAGRLILMLDPMRQHGLENLLFDWGILVYDDIIYDSNPEEQDEAGDLRLRFFAPHPITENLINNKLPVIVGPARVATDDRGRTADDGLSVTKLIAASSTAWGAANYRLQIPHEYTPGQDLRDPNHLGVMVVSERLKPASLPLSVRGGRLVVIGTADLITNNRIINQGNLNLFLSTLNWCADRDTQVNIPVRPIERYQLTLSQDELGRLRIGLLFLVPGAVTVLGLLVYWTRRN
ncbi:MAG: GldG family protein [Opitutales bacterium]